MSRQKNHPLRANIIYGLIDPRSLLIRYIGMGLNYERPFEHLDDLNLSTRKARWLQELEREGLKYDACVLERCDTRDQLPKTEIWWIAYGRCLGWPLTNATDGGEGGVNPTQETRDKISAALSGNTHRKGSITPQFVRDKQSAALLGRPGRPHTEETKRRLREIGLGRTLSPEHAYRISEGVSSYWANKRSK